MPVVGPMAMVTTKKATGLNTPPRTTIITLMDRWHGQWCPWQIRIPYPLFKGFLHNVERDVSHRQQVPGLAQHVQGSLTHVAVTCTATGC